MPPLPAHLLSVLGATFATPWVAWQEKKILREGQPLSAKLLDWAATHKIKEPRKIRTLEAHPIPLPAPMPIRRWLDARGFPSIRLAGLSLRNGIYLQPDIPHRDELLQHELIHTRQYQEAESIFTFLRHYLFQCLTEGYQDCQMEREARREL